MATVIVPLPVAVSNSGGPEVALWQLGMLGVLAVWALWMFKADGRSAQEIRRSLFVVSAIGIGLFVIALRIAPTKPDAVKSLGPIERMERTSEEMKRTGKHCYDGIDQLTYCKGPKP